ncbi:MAG: hypothetical protein K2Z81_20710 [Cyanobacteria bacterium]|nr:hypothetical protein [Cyanobacteriota bacterium]
MAAYRFVTLAQVGKDRSQCQAILPKGGFELLKPLLKQSDSDLMLAFVKILTGHAEQYIGKFLMVDVHFADVNGYVPVCAWESDNNFSDEVKVVNLVDVIIEQLPSCRHHPWE